MFQTTGCSIIVQSEMLPNSSERAVTLSGAPSTIIHCIDMLIEVMIQVIIFQYLKAYMI